MKKLTVIVKPANREDVIDIMESCAVYGVMETDITGYGNQKGYRVMYRGAMSGPNVLMKCKFETVGDDKTIENCASHSRYFSDELDAQNFYQKEEQMFDIFLCIWYTIFMKKDMFTINKNGLSYGRGYVYSLQYHLVWCTKYRKKVLKDGIDVECKEMLESLAQEYKFQILAMEVMPDHIHLLVDCRPQFYISDMIKIMKGNLARQMFLLHPELKKELWGGHLWNPSYCAVTVSDRSREQVLAYIEGQKEKSR